MLRLFLNACMVCRCQDVLREFLANIKATKTYVNFPQMANILIIHSEYKDSKCNIHQLTLYICRGHIAQCLTRLTLNCWVQVQTPSKYSVVFLGQESLLWLLVCSRKGFECDFTIKLEDISINKHKGHYVKYVLFLN